MYDRWGASYTHHFATRCCAELVPADGGQERRIFDVKVGEAIDKGDLPVSSSPEWVNRLLVCKTVGQVDIRIPILIDSFSSLSQSLDQVRSTGV